MVLLQGYQCQRQWLRPDLQVPFKCQCQPDRLDPDGYGFRKRSHLGLGQSGDPTKLCLPDLLPNRPHCQAEGRRRPGLVLFQGHQGGPGRLWSPPGQVANGHHLPHRPDPDRKHQPDNQLDLAQPQAQCQGRLRLQTYTGSGTSSATTSLTLTSSDSSKWICFEAQNDGDTAWHGVGGTQLEVSLEQYGQTLVAESNLTADWSHVRTENSAACSSLTYPTATSSKYSTINLTLDDQNQYYCFKTEASGQTIYQKAEIARQYTLDLEDGDNLGRATALDGDWMAVGAPLGRDVYIYRKANNGWHLQQEISDQTANFGSSLALDKNTLVVGASGYGVYIFTYNINTWSLQKENLVKFHCGWSHSTIESDDRFGSSISLDNNTLAVGLGG